MRVSAGLRCAGRRGRSAEAHRVAGAKPLASHDVAQLPMLVGELQDAQPLGVIRGRAHDDVRHEGHEFRAARAPVLAHYLGALVELRRRHAREVQVLVLKHAGLRLHERPRGRDGRKVHVLCTRPAHISTLRRLPGMSVSATLR